MAVNEISRGGLNAVLNKTLNMKSGPPAPTLGAEVVPVLPIESDRPEWKFLQGEIYVASNALAQTPAAAPGRSRFQCRNPSGSGVLCVVEQIAVSFASPTAAVSMTLQIRVATNLTQAILASGNLPGIVLDTRVQAATNVAPVPIIFAQDNVNADPTASATVKAYEFNTQGAAISPLPWFECLPVQTPIILGPGTQCFVVAVTNSGALVLTDCNFSCRVRPLEPTETV